MQRVLPLQATASAVLLLSVGCSESGTPAPTGPAPPPPPPPLAASFSPAADTVQTGRTTDFTLEITGGDPSAAPDWGCSAAHRLVASVYATPSGCSATGRGSGTTIIEAIVTRGGFSAGASASLTVTLPPLAAVLSPAADTVQAGRTAEFTLGITGGAPSAAPAWRCASADTTVVSAAETATGCSATGAGGGTTTIAATVTRGTLTAAASTSLGAAGVLDTLADADPSQPIPQPRH